MNTEMMYQLERIARHYGAHKQICKLIEELGEAVSAASMLQMLLSFNEGGGKISEVNKVFELKARFEHLAEELADVRNLTDQMLILFGLSDDFDAARMAGIDKTLDRIGRETDRPAAEARADADEPRGWVNAAERLPYSGRRVLCAVSGKPQSNITWIDAIEFGEWTAEGWIIEAYPLWDAARVSWWMYAPEPPESVCDGGAANGG